MLRTVHKAWTLTTAPTTEPISLAEAKAHLRDLSGREDSLIESWIVAARKYVEGTTWRQLITGTWTLNMDAWTWPVFIEHPPLQSVTSIKYFDTSNAQQTLSSSLYQVDIASQPGRIVPVFGEIWPDLFWRLNPIEIIFVAGYGDGAMDVPAETRQAMLILIGHFSENHEAVLTGTISKAIEFGVQALLGVNTMAEIT